MDRKKEEIEELNNLATIVSSTAPTITTVTANILATPTDDDISTESSDTFESWTLVNDKEKDKIPANFEDESDNRIAVLKNSDNDEDDDKEESKIEQELQLNDSPSDVNNDDLSDGISIISENESSGRLSPHPFIRDHLHDLNIRFSLSDHMDDTILNRIREEMENETVPLLVKPIPEPTTDQQLRQRRTLPALDSKALQKASQTIAPTSELVHSVKKGLQRLFYVSVGLALLGLIGQIVYPVWQPFGSFTGSLYQIKLEKKITELELENHVMRAEIDLLNKQVKYLTAINEEESRKLRKNREIKAFKAWLGNGDSLKPVDITKQDLKKPYHCPDGSFVEIANMCIEKRSPNEPNTEKLQDYHNQLLHEDQLSRDKIDPRLESEKEYKKSFGLDDNRQSNEYKKDSESENSSGNSQESNKWKTDTFINNYKKYRKANSKERRHTKDFDDSKENQSKERYNKQKRKYDKENDNDDDDRSGEWPEKYIKIRAQKRQRNSSDGSGEWHEKYMKHREQERNKLDGGIGEWQEKYMRHREQQRMRNDQKYPNNKNWFMKRADSRENKRSGEKQYR